MSETIGHTRTNAADVIQIIMLAVHPISKSYGIQPILSDISFSINAGERIGLVGPNGCGKTTLMRILAGVESPGSGSVTRTRPNLSTGHLAQGAEFETGETIETVLGLREAALEDSQEAIVRLASAFLQHPKDEALQTRYDAAIRQLSAVSRRRNRLLESLGLAEKSLASTIEQLSGGQKTRLVLAQILLRSLTCCCQTSPRTTWTSKCWSGSRPGSSAARPPSGNCARN